MIWHHLIVWLGHWEGAAMHFIFPILWLAYGLADWDDLQRSATQ